MTRTYKRIVSLARKRTRNPEKERQFLEENLPKYSAVIPEDGGMLAKIDDIFFNTTQTFTSYVLEIGFGTGENLVFNAKNFPEKAFIGCEVFTGGVVALLKQMEEQQISNIRIWADDAAELIARIPNNSLSLIYILHPDPWPKKRHHKRRLICKEFLLQLEKKLKQDGEILIITDHAEYAEAIDEEIKQVLEYYDIKNDNFPPITKTKYRLKADQQGIESKYFYLVKKLTNNF
jgi:tRNA (guanine-N7-)-methyltransferase